ncbi:hypothetical protein NG798_26395 [Ancylothrix sp. C2]|uniref:hypothetical protein n=1 Tax=Ancylothrix sp. D3o TaxID=2953691 RepID=UPI0021BA4AA0|nr:hypothetical protein [Ancylothrix sp. D3o]MCT7953334.1 hypothetical protein [Ancylothrix sp. D3o]
MVFKTAFSKETNPGDLSPNQAFKKIMRLLESGIFDLDYLLRIRDNLDELILEEQLTKSPSPQVKLASFYLEKKRINGKVYIYLRHSRSVQSEHQSKLPDKYIGSLPLEIGKTYRMQPINAKTSVGEKIVKVLNLFIENESDIFLKAEVNGSVVTYSFPDCFSTVFSKKEWKFVELVEAASTHSVDSSVSHVSQYKEIQNSNTAPLKPVSVGQVIEKPVEKPMEKSVGSKVPPERLYSVEKPVEKPMESEKQGRERVVMGESSDISLSEVKVPKKIDLTQQPSPKVVFNIVPEQSEQFIKSLKQWVMLSEFPVTAKKLELKSSDNLVVLSDKLERTTILTYRRDSCQIKSFYGARVLLGLMSDISFAVAQSPSVGNLNCSIARRFFVRLEACHKTLPETTMLAYLFNVTEQK